MTTLISQIDRAESRYRKSTEERDAILQELERFKRGIAIDWRRIDKASRYKTRLERLGKYAEAKAIVDTPQIQFNPLERILAASELSSIEFFERGMLAARAVGRVQIKDRSQRAVGYGSGTMISDRLFITNNHVISDGTTASHSTVQFDYLEGVAGLRDPVTFRCMPDEFFVTDRELDFTVIAIEPTNSSGIRVETRGWNPLIATSGKATVGERVNIIQHPAGDRLHVVVRDNVIIGVVDSFLHYRADTEPGSSGSPVFNDQWEMAALHHAGKPKRDDQNRILMVDGKPWTGRRDDIPRIDWEANEGIRISEIVSFMDRMALSATQKLLWARTQTTPQVIDVWGLFTDAGVNEVGLKPGADSVAISMDENGNPSWLFRLSFGPVPTAATPRPHRSEPPSLSEAPPSSAGGRSGMSEAERIVERLHHDGPYYDEEADSGLQTDYWHKLDLGASSSNLFSQLSAHLRNTHVNVYSYSKARHEYLYPVIDLHPDGNLRNIYSGEAFSPVEAIAAELEALITFSEAIGVEVSKLTIPNLITDEMLWDDLERSASLSFNCEHVVCQSWFEKRQPMRADLHHLFACQPGCNSFRSNIPYWQFSPEEEVSRDNCGRREGNKFEPEHGKGAVARATMYFLMRYPGEVGDDSNEFAKNRSKILINWHKEFPVDEYELHRNWLTQVAQGNRNPFIDHPSLATVSLLERGFG